MGKLSFDAIERLRPRGSCGYADLLIAHATQGAEGRDALAALLGYERRIEAPRKQDSGPRPETVIQVAEETADFEPQAPAPTPFWYLVEREFLKGIEEVQKTSARRAVTTASLADEPPQSQELSSWKALISRLRAAATECTRGKAPDIEAIVRHFGAGRCLQRLPRLNRRRWGSGIQIIVDRSSRLTPFQDDQDRVAVRLATLFPRQAVEFALTFDGLEEPLVFGPRETVREYRTPGAGTLVMVLGDLGCFARDPGPIVKMWKALGRRLVSAGCRPAVLNPCPRFRWPSERLVPWAMLEWERSAKDTACSPKELEERVQRLLRLLSPAIRIEPGLLRETRLLLGERGDAGTEADAWRSLGSRSRVAGTLDPTAANRLRKEFSAEDISLRTDVVKRIQKWRGGLPREIWYEELLSLDAETQAGVSEQGLAGDLQAARQSLIDLAPELEGRLGGRAWYRRLYERVSRAYHEQQGDPELRTAQYQLFEAAYQGTSLQPAPPPGFDLALIPHGSAAPRRIAVRQRGGCVVAAFADDDAEARAGSLLSHIDSRNGIQIIPETFWKSNIPPAWAEAWGTDGYGHWVTFSLKTEHGSAIQRLRWIEPGTFLMGSPESEAGRLDREGPRHEVTISKGFWLFDTACTQGLWEAVMGDNPSHFKGPDRPVENVSWDDVQAFLAGINERVSGLDLVLPSEAQWEYACRAGTTTPFSFGENITPEQVNYDGNHPYRGGKKGLNRQATSPVASLPSNPWGLHEMHGNVWEWCADHWHGSYEGAPSDGSAWIDPGAGPGGRRVLRGGSWVSNAGIVRSACRDHFVPGFRYDYGGFRCARVQEGAERRTRTASARTREATGIWLRLDTGQQEESGTLPKTPSFVIASDCERLTFRQMTCPSWASAIGRDRFGLWVEIEFEPDTQSHSSSFRRRRKGQAKTDKPVTQRLRWISPGRFFMGSPASEAGRIVYEGPRHEVTISKGFWLFDTTCTQGLWEAVMGNNPSHFRGPDRPVDNLSWYDLQKFLAEINERVPGLRLVLPSEAQWEYACRAGTTTPFSFGETITPEQVNYDGNYPYAGGKKGLNRQETVSVASLPANPWGLYEMHGNVCEWCADGQRSYTADLVTDPMGPTDAGVLRVLRGGSWGGGARVCRAAVRLRFHPGIAVVLSGFRPARVQES